MTTFAHTDEKASVPAMRAVPVTKSDVTVMDLTRGLYIGTGGDVVVRMADEAEATFKNVAAGILPVQCTQVRNATTAADILALY